MTGIAATPALHARLLRDHLVVVDLARGEVRVLNPSAAFLWLSLDQAPHGAAGLVRSWAMHLANPPADLRAVVQATLDEWCGLGWLEVEKGTYRVRRYLAEPPNGLRGRGVFHPADTPLPGHEIVAQLSLSLGEHSFLLTLGETSAPGFPEPLARLRAVLTGLLDPAPAANRIRLRWVHDGGSFWFADPDAVLWTQDESLALSSVVTALFVRAYRSKGLFATLHAAAVAREDAALLLPGISGSGKSTLAAYLAAHGWNYLGDDVIALGRTGEPCSFVVHPFPTAIGIKTDSWPVLRPYFPAIDQLPVVRYADRQARFLPLPRLRSGAEPSPQLRAIVLPHYAPGETTRIDTISPVEAFCALIQSGMTTGERIDPVRLDALLDLLDALPAYRMRHGDLHKAATLLEELLA